MNLNAFTKTWRGAIWENYWNRALNVGLVLILGLSVFKLATIKPVVVLQPPTLTKEAAVSSDSASKTYLESWGLYLGLLLGNVTPGTIGLIKETLGPLLSPGIYQEVMDVLEDQALEMEQDNIKRRFEPRYIESESSTGKMFVYGHTFTKTLNGEEERSEFTFEFKIDIDSYRPEVTYIDAYSDRPRNTRVLATMKRREQSDQDRKKREAGQ